MSQFHSFSLFVSVFMVYQGSFHVFFQDNFMFFSCFLVGFHVFGLVFMFLVGFHDFSRQFHSFWFLHTVFKGSFMVLVGFHILSR